MKPVSLLRHRGLLADELAGRVHPLKSRIRGNDIRALTEERGKFFVKAGANKVIGIEKVDEFARGQAKSGIAGGGKALVGLLNIANAVSVAGRDRRGIVGRTVIDDDDFEFLEGLS